MRFWWTLECGLVSVSLLTLVAGGCSEAREPAPETPAEDSLAPADDNGPLEPPGVGLSPDETLTPDEHGDSEPEPENGQTGSPGASECFPSDNSDDTNPSCAVDVTDWTTAFGRAELVRGRCGHSYTYTALPSCECTLRVTPSRIDATTGALREPYEFVALPGNRPGGCSEFARTPDCLYCESDFPGCSIDDWTSCDAVCQDVAERYDSEFQETFSASSRVAHCKQSTYCEWVTEIDGQCYARNPNTPMAPAFDCSLSNAAILEHSDEMYEAKCPARPVSTCTAAQGCAAGLTCSEGRCVSCSPVCQGGDSVNEGTPTECGSDLRCADDEACIEGSCIPQANVTCRSFTDCPENQLCALSGMVLSGGRGNAATRSFCRPSPGD